MFYVFVYGSLKKGFHNNVWFDENDEFIMTTTTKKSIYNMYSLGGFPTITKGGKFKIKGELYKIDPRTLKDLDRLESNGHLYNRELINLDNFDSQAWSYFWIDIKSLLNYSTTDNIDIKNNTKSWIR
jgi:gamma-glutamylcyclotransferase (GGCT)/AIG2-like uncharacterized protein YtfP